VPKNQEKAKTLREIYIKDLRYVTAYVTDYNTLHLPPAYTGVEIYIHPELIPIQRQYDEDYPVERAC